jgi:hypothetical protein
VLFEEQATEFVNVSTDICTDRESDTIKNCSAKLILSLNSNVDGMQTFMIDFCLTMIENIVKQSNEQCKSYVNTVLSKFELVFADHEHIIEVCLMVISILNRSFKKRQDLLLRLNAKFKLLVAVFLNIPELKSFVGDEFESLAEKFGTPLIRQRMVLCLDTVVDVFHNTNIVDD